MTGLSLSRNDSDADVQVETLDVGSWPVDDRGMRDDLPNGTITFLFTDVEGSTMLLHELGDDAYADALAQHRRIVRESCVVGGGVEVDTQGDAFFFAFPSAVGAVGAAQAITDGLSPGPIAVRIGLHTGTPLVTDEGYVGGDVHLAARIAASGHGGQVLLSTATRELVGEVSISDLGEHRLKDIEEAVPIYQMGMKRFPPLKTISNTNLPRPVSSFVGRRRERDEVVSMLSDGTRLLTLSGPGGSGKTRLAIEAASELVPAFKAGVFWVSLSALHDPALVTQTIAQTIGAQDDLAAHVSERELMLLLDNFEQVVAAAPEVSQLLEACPNLRVLVTSRELLRIRGEVEYPVSPLAEPEAVELFCARARVEPDETIAELCRRLDDMPLAVELAAARTSVLTPAQIRDRLARRLDLLKGGPDVDPRQQTLRATIEWSYDLLTDDEQQLFAGLAVFPGGCTIEAAEDVCDADIDTLQSLVDKNLLRHAGERFWMLETIREYASERLEDNGEPDRLAERHARWYLSLAKTAYGDPRQPGTSPLRGAAAGEWFRRLDAELANFRQAIGWAHDHDAQLEVELVEATSYYLYVRDLNAERLTYNLQALETARSASLDQAELLKWAALTAARVGDYASAQQWSEERLELARTRRDPWLIADSLYTLTGIAFSLGDADEIRRLALATADVGDESGNPIALMGAAHVLAMIALETGDYPTSRDQFSRELELARALPNPRAEAIALTGLARLALLQRDPEDAARNLDSVFRIMKRMDNWGHLYECLLPAAELAMQRGDLTRAARLVGAVDALAEEWGEPRVRFEDEQRARILNALADDATLQAAQSQGRTLTLEDAVDLALGESG